MSIALGMGVNSCIESIPVPTLVLSKKKSIAQITATAAACNTVDNAHAKLGRAYVHYFVEIGVHHSCQWEQAVKCRHETFYQPLLCLTAGYPR